MKAVVFEKKGKLVLTERPRPCLERDTDVLVRVTLTTICSSDIHIKHGAVPNAVPGTILGHEFVGVVEETGKAVKKVKPGDRVAVNVETFCGSCFYCERGFVNNCSDPLGGWALGCRIDGGQAEYVRIPYGDNGLTGRKIIVDTYGGAARHGGGSFSGKDCTKVDRSAAYAARYIAKNIVASGIAERCEIQLSYAIGVAQPVSISVDMFYTGKLSEERVIEIIKEIFDLSPDGIIRMLNLRRPIYKQTAAYGHFGRPDLDLPWEQTDRADLLRRYF